MKLRRVKLEILLMCLLGTAMPWVLYGQEGTEPAFENPGTPPSRENREMGDLLRKMQEVAEQSQAELKRSREQNERLQQLLEQTHQELAQLREEMKSLRSSMFFSRSISPSEKPVAQSEEEAIRKPAHVGDQTDASDSLETRLSRVEDQAGLNTAQIIEQAQTKVESESRFKVRLFGMVLNNTYFNTSDSSNNAVPTVALPYADSGNHNLGATLRQTQIGFSMTGPKLGAARLSSVVEFDFFGGVAAGYSGDVLGVLRMRTASVRLDGPKTSLAIGVMTPMISSLNPTSFAAVYYPALGESGNLWQWLPQIVGERRIPVRDDSNLIFQGGLILPFGETVNGAALAGRPGYESRMAFSRKLRGETLLEIGIGGFFQPQHLSFNHKINSYAATSDWRVRLTRHFELSGEAFYGQSISLTKPSGADIADAFSFNGSPFDPLTEVRGIHSAGGWAQLNAEATARLDFNFSFGLDDPRNRDIFPRPYNYDVRLKNETFAVNSIYRFRSNFLVSAEYRRLWTRYPYIRTANNHLNLAIGYLF
jgi:hypothetical protein